MKGKILQRCMSLTPDLFSIVAIISAAGRIHSGLIAILHICSVIFMDLQHSRSQRTLSKQLKNTYFMVLCDAYVIPNGHNDFIKLSRAPFKQRQRRQLMAKCYIRTSLMQQYFKNYNLQYTAFLDFIDMTSSENEMKILITCNMFYAVAITKRKRIHNVSQVDS